MVSRALAVGAGLVADRAFGEPPTRWHPVARFGLVMGAAERRMWADRRMPGLVFALGGAGIGVGAGAGLAGRRSTGPCLTGPRLTGPRLTGRPSTCRHSTGRRWAVLAGATFVSVAARALREAAEAVAEALHAGDLPEARARLGTLVGRRTEDLGEAEIVRAVVESVAENTVDAVVAPVFWALVAGPSGALGYRAVNTLDAMVGYHSPRYERFGWASARADDVANWVPARLTAALVALVRPARAADIWQAVRQDAPAHPSPNAGVAEASFAAALGVRLGGTNVYGTSVEHRPRLGTGPAPDRHHIEAACRLSRDVVAAVALVALAPSAGGGRRKWCR